MVGSAGATVNGNTFSATAAGTAVVRATIPNGAGGADFTQDFTITVSGTQGNNGGNNDDQQSGGNGNGGGDQQSGGGNNDGGSGAGSGGNYGGGGDGGCNITGNIFAMLLALPLVFRRKKK